MCSFVCKFLYAQSACWNDGNFNPNTFSKERLLIDLFARRGAIVVCFAILLAKRAIEQRFASDTQNYILVSRIKIAVIDCSL